MCGCIYASMCVQVPVLSHSTPSMTVDAAACNPLFLIASGMHLCASMLHAVVSCVSLSHNRLEICKTQEIT